LVLRAFEWVVSARLEFQLSAEEQNAGAAFREIEKGVLQQALSSAQ
jgi:hypothetical protein